VVGNASHTALASDNSVLTDGAGNNTANGGILATTTTVAFVKPINFLAQTDPDQPVVLPESTVLQTALTFDEGGNFINVILSPLTPWDLTAGAAFGSVRGDYHIQAGSVAANAGTNRTGSNRVPTADYDGDNRPSSNANRVDVGADEATAGGGTGGGTPALAFTGESGSGSFNTVLGVTTFGFGNVGNNTINTLTLTAGGTAPSVIGAVSVTGARFSITGNTCSGVSLAVGATCTIQLRFDGGGGFFGINPSVGNLTVDYNGTPAQLVLPISGS
jgi:large repetitive protein